MGSFRGERVEGGVGRRREGGKGGEGPACSVPRVDAFLLGVFEEGQGLLLVDGPVLPLVGAPGHAAHDHLADL